MSDDCIFCNIADGTFHAYTIYEDDAVKAFLDINPVSPGHVLVIPKTHAETLTDLDGETAEAVFRVVRDMAETIEERLEPAGVNLLQNNGEAAGQEVNHVHVHVIPRYEADGFEFSFNQQSLREEDAEKLLHALTD